MDLKRLDVCIYDEMSCIVVYKKRRYDVGRFVDAHPGGRDLIVQHENQDITDAYDDIGHSTSADEILAGYLMHSDDHASGSVNDDSASSARSLDHACVRTGQGKSNHTRETTRILCAIVGFAGLCHFFYHYGTWSLFIGTLTTPV